MRVMHLNKSGSGVASKTACGRNIIRTPLSTGWADFKNNDHQCSLCAASKQAELNVRSDASKWEPEASDAWMKNDDALFAK